MNSVCWQNKGCSKTEQSSILNIGRFYFCNGGNKFLSSLSVGIIEVKAEVIAFDPESCICFRSETLQNYFVGWNVHWLDSKDVLIRSFQGWTVLTPRILIRHL